MDAWFNTWATAPATVAGTFALLTAVLYGIGSPWYRSLLGTVFFLLFLGSVPVFALVLVRRIASTIANGGPSTSGDGFGLFAFAVYSFVAVVWVGVFLAVLYTRRHTPTPTPPLERRPAPNRASARH
ncbi:putative phage holin [Curtobacterium flaccumfaciens]|uniref:putative phage holin n=1 Tax=Curtobacterium flaccumfaciens TaxID=2035 RepID=UPI00112D3E46|nr:hypothetical protein [Curtobacterium flaccumfaciens]TPG05600.1 hypothetical protein EAH85_12775 [Curtobacterium flaccumfaciens]